MQGALSNARYAHVAHEKPCTCAVLTSYDYVFAENGLVAYEAGKLTAVQSLKVRVLPVVDLHSVRSIYRLSEV